jgi:hypothetical protein
MKYKYNLINAVNCESHAVHKYTMNKKTDKNAHMVQSRYQLAEYKFQLDYSHIVVYKRQPADRIFSLLFHNNQLQQRHIYLLL